MADYYASDSTYGRKYDRADPSAYGRSYERVDRPSTYGRSYGGTDPSLMYGSYDRPYGSDSNYGSRPSATHGSASWSGKKEYDTNGGNWGRQSASPAYDRLGFDEHVTKVAMEYIQPKKSSNSVSNSYHHGPNSSIGYDDRRRLELYKSSGYPVHGENYDDFSRKEYSSTSGHSAKLSNPTNDIGTAVRYLDEAARTVAPGSRLAETTTKIHSYAEKLEPVEPSKRYGTYNMFARQSTSG